MASHQVADPLQQQQQQQQQQWYGQHQQQEQQQLHPTAAPVNGAMSGSRPTAVTAAAAAT
jgi:hypothetical protein